MLLSVDYQGKQISKTKKKSERGKEEGDFLAFVVENEVLDDLLEMNSDDVWTIDSGCSIHMCYKRDILIRS